MTISVLLVEAAILLPALYKHEEDHRNHQAEIALNVIRVTGSTLQETDSGSVLRALQKAQDIGGYSGLQLIGENLVELGGFGVGAASDRDFWSRRWLPEDIGLPVGVVLYFEHEESGLAEWFKIFGLALLVALFASSAALVFLGRLVLLPILGLREKMIFYQNHPEVDPAEIKTERTGEDLPREVSDLLDHFEKMNLEVYRAHQSAQQSVMGRFQDFVGLVSDWFWEMDSDLRFTFISERYSEITGYPAKNLIGKRRGDQVIPGLDHEEWQRHLRTLEERQAFIDFRHPRVSPDGLVRWVSVSGFPRFDGGGKFLGYRGIGRDVTEQMQSDIALKRNRASLAKAQRMARMGNWELDLITGQLHWSDEVYRIFQVEKEEFNQTTSVFYDRVHPEDRAAVSEETDRAIAEGGVYSFFHRLVLPDGEIRIVHETAEVELDEGNEPVRLVGTVQDVTEQKKVERALIEAKTEAEFANRAKSEFLASMSHELRTPLNAILGFSEMISREYFGAVNDKYHEYAGDIQTSATHLLSLVNEVLDMSAIEAGKRSMSFNWQKITEILQECQKILATSAEAKSIQVVLEAAQGGQVWADRMALKQVLINLVSNSIKYGKTGGQVTIKVERSEGQTAFCVSDNGPGIPLKDRQRVLEPFFQVEISSYTSREGLGLGLPITKSLIEMHGGSLEIESGEEGGTAISFILPDPLAQPSLVIDRR